MMLSQSNLTVHKDHTLSSHNLNKKFKKFSKCNNNNNNNNSNKIGAPLTPKDLIKARKILEELLMSKPHMEPLKILVIKFFWIFLNLGIFLCFLG